MHGCECVEFSTSGSTGSAKKIVKTSASLNADARMLLKAFPDLFGGRPYVVTTIREEHMFGMLWRRLLPAIGGCEVYPEAAVSVEELLSAAAGRAGVLLVTTPSFLEKALDNGEFGSLKSSLIGIVTSGSLLKKDLSRRIESATGISPTEIFGSTETGSVAWRRQKNGEEWSLFDGVCAERTDAGLISVDSGFSIARPFVMSDLVEFTAPRRFLLLGRADRNVKILEKYVSLPRLEAAMERHPLVAKAHAIASDEPVPRIRAIVELSREGKQALKRGTYSDMTALLRREIAGVEAFAFPRRIRYLNRFPYNEQGKLVRSTVASVLESRYQEPVSENETGSADGFSEELTFLPDAVYFDGHFRDFKILPGVIQLDYILRQIQMRWRIGRFKGRIHRLKFQRPVLPSEKVLLEVKKDGNGRFSFVIRHEDDICSSGSLEWRE